MRDRNVLCVIYEKSTGFLYVSMDIHSLFPPQHVVNDVDDDTLPVGGMMMRDVMLASN